MLSLARRIVDRRVLHLIRMWLECSVEETDNRDRKMRTTEARDSRRGIPQGSPISPLLANIYMRRFVLAWKKLGLERSLGSRIVTYADDLVILCKRGNAEKALSQLRAIMGLPGFYVWANVLSDNWSGPYGFAPVEEEYPAHGRKDSCADCP